jgi:hypothetical protein
MSLRVKKRSYLTLKQAFGMVLLTSNTIGVVKKRSQNQKSTYLHGQSLHQK